jgi:hypothetical protein
MPLFVVHHTHSPETCPAADRAAAPMLLQHLSKENAARFGVTIHGEAVIDGGHALYLIVDAGDREKVSRYMQPFAQAGSVTVMPASHCEVVVGRGAC